MFKDRKFKKDSKNRPGQRSKKRRFFGNRYTSENEKVFASTSADKLKSSGNIEIIVHATHGYRIIDFVLVFSALSDLLKCKTCDSEVTFIEKGAQGLGFQLGVQCKCDPHYINSCQKIDGKAYEINRRIVFVMRLLGVGLHGLNLFCGLMDICQGLSNKTYYAAIDNIYTATKAVFNTCVKKAGEEEKVLNSKADNELNKLTLSGDGSCSKRGCSLFGVVTLIGKYSGKILDLVVKSSFCKACLDWKDKVDTPEYFEWLENHQENCPCNYKRSAGKMEVDGMLEMFNRAEELHGAKYVNYIGDGDTKTFDALLKEHTDIQRKGGQKFWGQIENNEGSFNGAVWYFAPKHISCASKMIEVAAFLAACIFNEGFVSILKIMEVLGVRIGPQTQLFRDKCDARRTQAVERRVFFTSGKAKIAGRDEPLAEQDFFEETEGLLFGPGIDD